MKEKRVILIALILTILISASFVFAAENTTAVDKAYSCLEDKLGTNCADSSNTEQLAFSLLAIASNSAKQKQCEDALVGKARDNCFGLTPTTNCDLKSTSEAILALDNINSDVDKYTDWLISKSRTADGMDWFLEIDTNNISTCTIQADGSNTGTFKLNYDKKITGSSSCLVSAEGGYFLKIANSCFNKNFTISCDKDFITTLLYKKSGTQTFYVSSLTHQASASGSTEEKVNAKCFSSSNSCDYEGSLWATLALARLGKDVSPYIPYLGAMYDDSANQRMFPSTFLFMLTSSDDYYSTILAKQKSSSYWEESTNNKYYDTALALLSLQTNSGVSEVESAKNYLLTHQDSSGCWHANDVKLTAFLLYAGWPKQPTIGGGGTTRSNCVDFSHYCISSGSCAVNNTLLNFYCPALSDVCCSVRPAEQSCSQKDGIICEENQECTGTIMSASDASGLQVCCSAACQEVVTENECESYGYTCQTSCGSGEDEKTYTCLSAGDVCCAASVAPGKSYLWVWLLAILIVLLILAIIFRNQLKTWLFRVKSGVSFGKGPAEVKRPPMPPTTPMPMFNRPRPILQRPIARPPQRQVPPVAKKSDKDAAFDETMKKLREMSK